MISSHIQHNSSKLNFDILVVMLSASLAASLILMCELVVACISSFFFRFLLFLFFPSLLLFFLCIFTSFFFSKTTSSSFIFPLDLLTTKVRTILSVLHILNATILFLFLVEQAPFGVFYICFWWRKLLILFYFCFCGLPVTFSLPLDLFFLFVFLVSPVTFSLPGDFLFCFYVFGSS